MVKRGGWSGLLIDLSLRPSQAATVVEAFGLERTGSLPGWKMCVPLLHAVLAQRAGALLIPVESEPLPDGTCRVRALPPVEWPEGRDFAGDRAALLGAFEPILHARPGEWLWPYKHFRYKPRDRCRTYPATRMNPVSSRSSDGRLSHPRRGRRFNKRFAVSVDKLANLRFPLRHTHQ